MTTKKTTEPQVPVGSETERSWKLFGVTIGVIVLSLLGVAVLCMLGALTGNPIHLNP